MNDKEPFGFVAEGALVHDINVAVIEYTLAPAIGMDGIVSEIRDAVAWITRHLGDFGAATDGVYIAGHSAGGQLAAMMMTEPGVKGGLVISGLFDLEPIRLSYLNLKLGMNKAEARRNSPIFHLPRQAPPLIVAVGGKELPELRRQSQEYYRAWAGNGLDGQLLPLFDHDHFSILEELARPAGQLIAGIRDLVGRTQPDV